MNWLSFLLAMCLLWPASPVTAAIYKVTGKDGKIIYTDKPPADNANTKELNILSFTGPAQQGALSKQPDWQSLLSRPAAAGGNANIVMFSTDWCGYCRQARQYMRAKGIAFSDLDVEKDAAARAEYAKLGGRGVPFFVIGKLTLAGFNESSFDATLRDAKK